MDELDRSLIALLREDARAPFTRLAEELGTSEGTVRARLKRLVEDGSIRRFTIRTAGSMVRALVEVQVTADQLAARLADEVRTWPGIEAVWEVTGEHDLVIVADCPTMDTLNDIIDRIRQSEGTVSTSSRLILREHA